MDDDQNTKRKEKRNKLYSGKVVGLTHKGEGLVEVQGDEKSSYYEVQRVFPDDIIKLEKYTSKRKNLKKKAMLSHIQFSPWTRINPVCNHYKICGGCSIQELRYEDQLKIKAGHVRGLLAPLLDSKEDVKDKLGTDTLYPQEKEILHSEHNYYYRNRVDYTCGAKRWLDESDIQEDRENQDRRGLGFHVKGFYDRVAHISQCYLHKSNDIREAVHQWALEHNISFFDSRTHEGLLRSLTLRNTLENHYMLIVSFTERRDEVLESLTNMLKEQFPSIVSVYSAVNTSSNDGFQNAELFLEYGEDHLVETCAHIQLKIMPQVFYQTNSYLAPMLYEAVREAGDFSGRERVLDLYCGVGSIGLYLAKYVGHVVGIEIVEESIQLAKENAKLNGIKNVFFYAGAAEDILAKKDGEAELDSELNAEKFDCIIIDPPRAGLHPRVVKFLLAHKSPRIIYVSCNPTTQAKDIALLSESYTLSGWQAADMFPQTYHVESIAVLDAKKEI